MGLAQIARIAINLMGKAVVLAAKWAGARRKRALEAMAARPDGDKEKEIVFLRDRVAQLQSQVEILRQLHKPDNTTRYTIRERFMIIFHLTYFAIPRRRVKECLGIGRSTLYRWLKNIGGERPAPRQAWNRTAAKVAALVWAVARANTQLGESPHCQSAPSARSLRRSIDSAQHPESPEASVALAQR